MNRSVFIFAGEQSGDLHGAAITQAIQKIHPDWKLSGVPGPAMRAAGIRGPLVTEDFSVMGFTDVLKALPRLVKHFFTVRNHILDTTPDCVVLIDYPGFNIRLAKSLRKKGYNGKILQYICPTVWAHGKGRITHMERDLDLLLTIFPFEVDCFKETKLPTRFAGNPLVDTVNQRSNPHATSQDNLIGIFPGSRFSEIRNNLPMQLEAAALFSQKHPDAIFGLSVAHEKLLPDILKYVSNSPIQNKIHLYSPKQHYQLMQECKVALATSGTVTLELALHSRPTVVSYVIPFANYLILRYIIKPDLKHYCIANILANERIFPELMREAPTASSICAHLESIYRDPAQSLKGCEKVRTLLTSPQPASIMAAREIEGLLQ